MAVFGEINKTVTTAATRVQVSTTDLFVKKIVVCGHSANTGHIYLGTVAVSATVGLQLKVGHNPVPIDAPLVDGHADMFNLKNMYVDASVSGEKVSILYFQ